MDPAPRKQHVLVESMQWIRRLPEVGAPFIAKLDALAAKADRLAELRQQLAVLEGEFRRDAGKLGADVRGVWTKEEISAAKAP